MHSALRGSVHSALCTWLYALGSMHLALCTWLYALGSMHLALRTWLHALGSMHSALCTRLCAIGSMHLALFAHGSMHLALCTWPYALGYARLYALGSMHLALCLWLCASDSMQVGPRAPRGSTLRDAFGKNLGRASRHLWDERSGKASSCAWAKPWNANVNTNQPWFLYHNFLSSSRRMG